jgi:hypothetical protein
MLRQALIFLLISILVILFSSFSHNMLFIYIKNLFTPIFNALDFGAMIQKICLLMLIPLTTTAIPAVLYRVIRGKQMPYLIESTWILWLILVLSTILIH